MDYTNKRTVKNRGRSSRPTHPELFILTKIVFRDSFISVLSAAAPGNLDEISSKLDTAGNTLEYRRYAETLFEILIAGRLLGMSPSHRFPHVMLPMI